ncbi:MAG: hypothetical protein ABI606_06320 [Rhodoferax sp.]
MSKARVKPAAATPVGVMGGLAVTSNATAPAVGDGAPPIAGASPQPVPDTAPYIVGDCPMLHDDEIYMPGDWIYLTPKQALRSARRVSLAVADFPKLNLE